VGTDPQLPAAGVAAGAAVVGEEDSDADGAGAEQPVKTSAPAPRIAAPDVVKRGKEDVFVMVYLLTK
jgi:hypothetical protein